MESRLPLNLSCEITEWVKEAIARAPAKRLLVTLRGGWKLFISQSDAGLEIEHFNPTESENRQFFVYTTEGNPYGAGKIVQEPDLAFPVLEKGLPLIGALVLDSNGKVAERYSWSNLVFKQNRRFDITGSNRLMVSDATSGEMTPKGYLKALFLPDKNRMTGYVGVFTPIRTRTVRILEMEDLLLASIMQ